MNGIPRIAAYGPILFGTGFHAHTSGFFRACIGGIRSRR
jgi:hypothetical protein